MRQPRRPLSAIARSLTGAGTVAAVAVLAGCGGGITAERATGGYVQGDYGHRHGQQQRPGVGGVAEPLTHR